MQIRKVVKTPYAISSVAINGDCSQLAASNGVLDEILIMDVDSGQSLTTLKMESSAGYENMLLWAGDYIIAAGNAGTVLHVWHGRHFQQLHRIDLKPCSLKSMSLDPETGRLLAVLKRPMLAHLQKMGRPDMANVCEIDLATGQIIGETLIGRQLLTGGYMPGSEKRFMVVGNEQAADGTWQLTAAFGRNDVDGGQTVVIAGEPANHAMWAYNPNTQQYAVVGVWDEHSQTYVDGQPVNIGDGLPCGITSYDKTFVVLEQRGETDYYLAFTDGSAAFRLPGEASNALASTGEMILAGVDNSVVLIA